MHHSKGRWLGHTPMTFLNTTVAELPTDAAALTRVVQGLLVHGAWLKEYDVDVGTFGVTTRATLPVSERIAALVRRDERELTHVRPVERREIGTCRDFALMVCALLRAKGTAARLRCGFASYLRVGWEDHWVCEYWADHAARWQVVDAQLDDIIATACGVVFDSADVPRDVFLTAGEAWLRCRAGSDDPGRFGHGVAQGFWFMGVNVVRDALALNNRETSDWDRWREATPEQRTVSRQEFAVLDELARTPEAALSKPMPPPWLAGGT